MPDTDIHKLSNGHPDEDLLFALEPDQWVAASSQALPRYVLSRAANLAVWALRGFDGRFPADFCQLEDFPLPAAGARDLDQRFRPHNIQTRAQHAGSFPDRAKQARAHGRSGAVLQRPLSQRNQLLRYIPASEITQQVTSTRTSDLHIE